MLKQRIGSIILTLAALAQGKQVLHAQTTPLALVADTVLDGAGKVIHHTTIIVEGTKIKSIGGPVPVGATVYNLGNLTIGPGFIDTHAHLMWHFDNGRFASNDEPPLQSILHAIDNGTDTIRAGFTTIQSPGSAEDVYLRAFWARDITPGPRIITSLVALDDKSGTPEQLRELVRERKAQGADFIKIFASKSIREGGAQTLTDSQLQAACGEAKRLGMRTLVHAHADSAVRAASNAGCTTVEHGAYATDETFALMVKNGTYYDPNIGLVLQNYIANKDKYLGIGNYNEAGFAFMEKGIEITTATFKRAIKIPGLKILYGTDAVAGAHGHNGDEFIARVQKGGQKPMDAFISMTSLSATSMNMGNQIGTLAPGMTADIVAMQGDPLIDPTSVRRILFVMKDGIVIKNDIPAHRSK